MSAFHKDFKIRGAIGEADQKDKLSYISLLKQIEEVKYKGYSDKEIVNPVKKAIIPGLHLQNVSETTDNMTLERLMKFLQSHLVERNTLDLNQHLTSLTQRPTGICHSIYLQSNEFKTKIVLANKSPAAEIIYDKHLAQKLLPNAVATCLSSERILSQIKSLFKDAATSDEDLIFAVG